MKKQTAGRDHLGTFAPTFARLNDDVLFGEVWARQGALPSKLRSIVTISSLISKGITDISLQHHLVLAKENGVSQEEMAEILTHLAFYAGWPNAWAAFRLAQDVYQDSPVGEHHGGFFGIGEPNEAFAQYFSGKSFLKRVSPEDGPLTIFNVTFEPGCRNHWHIHQARSGGGQVLICVEGHGWYQEEGQPALALHPGDIVEIPAGVKHWHGAQAGNWFSHLAFELAGEGTQTEWCEAVSDEDFQQLEKR